MIEENVMRHAFLGVATQQAEEQVLELGGRSDGNSEKRAKQIKLNDNWM